VIENNKRIVCDSNKKRILTQTDLVSSLTLELRKKEGGTRTRERERETKLEFQK